MTIEKKKIPEIPNHDSDTHTYAVRIRKSGRDSFCLFGTCNHLTLHFYFCIIDNRWTSQTKKTLYFQGNTCVWKNKSKSPKKRLFLLFLSVPCQSVLTLTWRQQNHWNRWNLLRLLRWTQRLSRQHQSCQSWIWELRVVENSLSEMSLRVKKVRVAFIQTFQQWANYD